MIKQMLLIVLLAGAAIGTAFADWEIRYLLFTDGQIYTVPTGLDPIPNDNCMPEGEPIQQIGGVSGDGDWFALLTTPADVAQQIASGEWPDDMPVPNNVWVCSTRQEARLVSFYDLGERDRIQVRSTPVWNPATEMTERRLAFTAVEFHDGNTQVILYYGQPRTGSTAFRSGKSMIGTYNVGITTPPRLWWGNNGIVVEIITPAEDGTRQLQFMSYLIDDNNRRLANDITVSPPTPGELPVVTELVRLPAGDSMALLWQSAGWQLIDSQTGASAYVTGSLELYNPLAPNGTTLVYDHNNFVSSTMTVYSEGRPFLERTSAFVYNEPQVMTAAAHFGIRDTGEIIYAGSEGIFEIFNDGRTFAIDAVDAGPDAAVFGGPTAFTFRNIQPREETEVAFAITRATPAATPMPAEASTATPPAQNTQNCPEGVPPRLIVGEQGIVIDELANNVRSQPALDAQKVGELPPGNIFAVLNGPVCADDFVWWEVDYNGLVGWTAEGENTTYWLAPLQ
ncbi:MAG: SH3 domain-containing protein [Chloroflexota bacterium]